MEDNIKQILSNDDGSISLHHKSSDSEILLVGNINLESGVTAEDEIVSAEDEYSPFSQQFTPFETAVSNQENDARSTGSRSFRLQDLLGWKATQVAMVGVLGTISFGLDGFLMSRMDKIKDNQGRDLSSLHRVGTDLAWISMLSSAVLAAYLVVLYMRAQRPVESVRVINALKRFGTSALITKALMITEMILPNQFNWRLIIWAFLFVACCLAEGLEVYPQNFWY